MHIVNTAVVKALMYLRCISEVELANLVHVPLSDFRVWLYDQAEDSEDRIPFETQIEVLKILGIHGESPRSDIVHYWRIHEPFFSRAASTYWALNVVLKSFGKAQAVFISREADPFVTFDAKAHFGLKFESFMAVLEVTAHPLRNISFNPAKMPDLTWVPDTLGVLLPEAEYERLEPGALKVRGLNQYLTYTTEMSQWEKLREAALENGIKAEAVAALMLGHDITKRLTAEPRPSEASDSEPASPIIEQPKKAKPEEPAIQDLHTRPTKDPEDYRLFSVPVAGAAGDKTKV